LHEFAQGLSGSRVGNVTTESNTLRRVGDLFSVAEIDLDYLGTHGLQAIDDSQAQTTGSTCDYGHSIAQGVGIKRRVMMD
jgi:hypothetical protein